MKVTETQEGTKVEFSSLAEAVCYGVSQFLKTIPEDELSIYLEDKNNIDAPKLTIEDYGSPIKLPKNQ